MKIFKNIYTQSMGDPLYRNSLFIMASTVVSAIFGFIFWIFIARLFPVENVGIATALISVMTLIGSFSTLGFNVGLIRYLPNSKSRHDIIVSSTLLVIISTILASLIYLLGIKIFSPKLSFLQTNLFYIITFTILVLGGSLNTIIESIYMAYRAAGNILVKNILTSILKLLLPFFMVSLGAYGIFAASSLSLFISVLLSGVIFMLSNRFTLYLTFKPILIKRMASYSAGNYIAGFLSQAPLLILPVLIVNILYAKAAAYYYFDSMILNLLCIIPLATTQSLLAEGSYDMNSLRDHIIKASKIIFFLLIPSIVLTYIFGGIALHTFGKNYESEAFGLLRILSISAIFMAISLLGNAILKVRKQISQLIYLNIFGFIAIMGFSYLFIHNGLTGLGWGWLIGQAFLAGGYIFVVGKNLLFDKKKIHYALSIIKAYVS